MTTHQSDECSNEVFALKVVFNMICEHSRIVLAADLPAHALQSGDVGTVVHIYLESKAYEVEFVSPKGDTFVVITLESRLVRPANRYEVTNARRRFEP